MRWQSDAIHANLAIGAAADGSGGPPSCRRRRWNRNLLGRKTRYAYLTVAEPWPRVSGFAKVDLETVELTRFDKGEGRFGGEACFVPMDPAAAHPQGEDDGYVLTFIHDEHAGTSELLVINAADMRLEATVQLPSRVPFGFHGTFITGQELEAQALPSSTFLGTEEP